MSDVIAEPMIEDEVLPDLEIIVPVVGEMDINGVRCRVNRLKTREFLALMRMMVRGAGPAMKPLLDSIEWDDQKQAVTDLLAVLMVVVPEAPEDFMAFLRSVVTPIVDDGKKVDKDTLLLWGTEMQNPELDTMLEIAKRIVTQEIDDLQALVGKAKAMSGKLGPILEEKSR